VSLQRDLEQARSSADRVVLEGIHPLKHAVRFGGVIERIVTPDPAAVTDLLTALAPDVVLPVEVDIVGHAEWERLHRGRLPAPVLAIARRPADRTGEVLARTGDAPVVLLDAPTHLGNVGAVIRVAAAAGADAVVVRGAADPWHPTALRGAAGLQFALPVGHVDALPDSPRPLVAVHPEGRSLYDTPLPRGAVLAFGTERHGLTADLLDRAAERVAIPMRPGVSSLNLATAVAVTLYAGRGAG
jgi:RNA methyltransferase, TrmH family